MLVDTATAVLGDDEFKVKEGGFFVSLYESIFGDISAPDNLNVFEDFLNPGDFIDDFLN